MAGIKKENSICLASDWLLNSGIQSDAGAFYAWRDLESNSYSFIYSEITGYAITTLLFLYKITKDDIFIERAKKAASWTIEYSLHPSGGSRTRLYREDKKADNAYSFSSQNIFSFDTGMVLYGMINLYRLTGEDRFLKASGKIADFLLEKMLNKNGSLAAVYSAESERKIESFDKWSNQAGAFGAKVCLGLLDLFGATGESRYRDAAVGICDYALTLQDETGRFITNRLDKTTHLHPHLYTAEGLLYAGVSFGVDKYISSAKKAAEWVFNFFPAQDIQELYSPKTKKFNNFQRSDILAQALRLGLIFGLQTQELSFLKALLAGYQYLESDPIGRGGFLYSRDRRHINSWCTMFSLQALALYQDRKLIPESKLIELFI